MDFFVNWLCMKEGEWMDAFNPRDPEGAEPTSLNIGIVYDFISKLPLQAKASFNIHTKVHRGEIKKKGLGVKPILIYFKPAT